MPLVILEGPDGSGKSTLANRLLKGTGFPTLLVRRSGPPGTIETLQFQSRWIADQADSGLNIIADRHPIISESIYGPVVRRAPGPFWDATEVGDALEFKDALLVYCRPPTDSLNRSSRVEDQMAGVHERFGPLLAEYDRWFHYLSTRSIDIITHDFSKDPSCRLAVEAVKNFWERDR